MSATSWRSIFFSVLLSSFITFLGRPTDAALEGSSMGFMDLPQTKVGFPRITHVSDVKTFVEDHAAASRRKRNIFYQNGLRLCGQETAEQVVSNHLNYFYLRVCQETVWEAFKIFWDRLPEQEEYQIWMSQCREGTATTLIIGSFFSQSKEHQALVKERLSHMNFKSEPTRSWQHMCSTPSPPRSEATKAPELDKRKEEEEAATTSGKVEESPLLNEITVQPTAAPMLEQVVELSILLTGEMFSDELNDPASLQFQALSRHLAEKIEEALDMLPGYKSVSVLDFRPQKDTQGMDGIIVDYAVTVLVNGDGVSSEQLNYLTLQSNQVESLYHKTEELSTVVYNQNKNDQQSEPEIPADRPKVSAVNDLPEVLTLQEDSLPEVAETNTVATMEKDVAVQEDREVPPAVGLVTTPPETSKVGEGSLVLEETVQTPETSHSGVVLPEAASPELMESSTLLEPPEASGTGLKDPAPAENVQVSVGDAVPEDGLRTEESSICTYNCTKAEQVDATAEEVRHPPVGDEDRDLGEVLVNQFSEDLAVPTTLLPEATEPVETPEEPPHTDVMPANEEVAHIPEGNESVSVHLELPTFEEVDLDETIIREEGNVIEDTFSEAPTVEEKVAQATKISNEDLTEDEILLLDKNIPEPPVTDHPDPENPTVLTPGGESAFTVDSIIHLDSEDLPDTAVTSVVEIKTSVVGLDEVTSGDHGVVSYGYGLTNQSEEGSTGFPSGVEHATDQASMAMPVNPGRALMVFFSLRVTNMIFSEDLFNKSSPEYKALEQRFLELLVPYLQSNLSHFENLEILNFRNGSIVVNSRMKFGKPVARGVTTTVYLILEDFCNTAYQTMNLAIDKYSLDVESGDQADPCKFQACNEYAECKVNRWSGEAECVCNAGYFSVDGLPCQSICELQTDFCLNDGKCDIIPGQGAICRCRVGENWWYRGEHCEEYVSEPLVVGIAIASVAGFLFVASGVLFFLARTLRDQYDKEESEDPIRRAESLPSLERATKYNPMYESEATTGYSHYYRRYPEPPVYSSASAEASTDFSSEEIRHIYDNSELTKEEIQDRIRIIELYAKDRQFADFVRQHQAVLDTCRENSSS